MVRFLYNLLLPAAFFLFLPGLLVKLVRRGGHKRSFLERFGIFSAEAKRRLLALERPVWVHAVSVGETQVALTLIKAWLERSPNRRFVLSTTTTTGQEIARNRAPAGTEVIFCPIDFLWSVRAALRLVRPQALVIFETELWPNLIHESKRTGAKVVMVNARLSDHSFRGYRRFRPFVAPILAGVDLSCAQSEADAARLKALCSSLAVEVTGNMKFDQSVPENLPDPGLGKVFGPGDFVHLLGASTWPGEERLLALALLELRKDFPALRLTLVPRHAERGAEVAAELRSLGVAAHRRSDQSGPTGAETLCLLADTTGEMLPFMNASDLVVVGKSLAGHREGQNLIEPALLGKPVLTGPELKNFRFAMNALRQDGAMIAVGSDVELAGAIRKLLADPESRRALGRKARESVLQHRGAVGKTINLLESHT